jgi:hypothetical protein
MTHWNYNKLVKSHQNHTKQGKVKLEAWSKLVVWHKNLIVNGFYEKIVLKVFNRVVHSGHFWTILCWFFGIIFGSFSGVWQKNDVNEAKMHFTYLQQSSAHLNSTLMDFTKLLLQVPGISLTYFQVFIWKLWYCIVNTHILLYTTYKKPTKETVE